MAGEGVAAPALVVADVAFVRLLIAVDLVMPPQIAFLGESHSADVALVGPLSSMTAAVDLEMALSCANQATLLALDEVQVAVGDASLLLRD